MIHELKTWPEPFAAILDGRKTFEVRKADRPFMVGDTLHLREWNPDGSNYTGRETAAVVTYLVSPGAWGLPPNLCVMGLASRSSSGSGEREAVHGEDVAHACAHAHGMGQEDGFRAGVEAAAKIVAGWHIKRGGYLVLAEAIRALSSAPPSHDSGKRERGALTRIASLARDRRRPEAQLDRIAAVARRALSPQGDGGTEG